MGGLMAIEGMEFGVGLSKGKKEDGPSERRELK